MVRNAAAALFLLLPSACAAVSFTDSRGATVELSSSTRFVTDKWTAGALHSLGVTSANIVGTFGNFGIHGSRSGDTTVYSNPTPEQIAFSKSIADVSPSCAFGAVECDEFDFQTFQTLGVDFVLTSEYLNVAPYTTAFEANLTVPLITYDLAATDPTCTFQDNERCPGITYLQALEQLEVFAEGLGVTESERLLDDRMALFQASMDFQAAAKEAHSKGVRIIASYPIPDGTAWIADPTDDLVLRMLEELGAPLLHTNACDANSGCTNGWYWEQASIGALFPDCDANAINAGCASNPIYPADPVLLDPRSRFDHGDTDPNTWTKFPYPALLAGQFMYLPLGAWLLTHAHAAEILNRVAEAMRKAVRIHPATDCTPGVAVSSDSHRAAGIGPNQYGCFDKSVHDQRYCEGLDDGSSDAEYYGGTIGAIAAATGAMAMFL